MSVVEEVDKRGETFFCVVAARSCVSEKIQSYTKPTAHTTNQRTLSTSYFKKYGASFSSSIVPKRSKFLDLIQEWKSVL
jgi:hypothetical protein